MRSVGARQKSASVVYSATARSKWHSEGLHENGGGPEGTLIETRDEPGRSLDAATITSVIDEVILG